jgi:hypothetical protein
MCRCKGLKASEISVYTESNDRDDGTTQSRRDDTLLTGDFSLRRE